MSELCCESGIFAELLTDIDRPSEILLSHKSILVNEVVIVKIVLQIDETDTGRDYRLRGSLSRLPLKVERNRTICKRCRLSLLLAKL
jgi:hypothetical protein